MFAALVEMIEHNSGRGFHNVDQGHPAYRCAKDASGKFGDSPERNDLFQTLLQFDEKYHDEIRDLSTWQKFCRFASESFSMSGSG